MNCRKLITWLGATAGPAILALDGTAATESNALAASETSDQPQLSAIYSNGQINIGWPLGLTGWVLEQAPALDPNTPWNYVPSALFQTNTTNVSIAISSSETTFYRLRKLAPAALTADWSFDEGFGQIAQDSSGSNNGAGLSNVAWTAGRIGAGAVWFNGGPPATGSRGWVSNDTYRVLGGGAFTVSLWFNPDALTTGWRGLIGNDANGSNGWHLALHSSGPGTNELVFASPGSSALNVTGCKLLLPGQWHELTATYDGNEGIIYLDSVLLARGAGSILPNNQPIYFGGGIANFDSFLGRIDEVRIYTNALTYEDISLAGYWHLDENGGLFAADSSIRGHHATVLNPAAWDQGKNGSGIDLSNTTVSIRNDFADLLPPTGGSFSLSFWLLPNSLPLAESGLMSCADSTNTGWNLTISSTAPGGTRLRFWSTNSGGTLDLSAPVPLQEGVWSKIDLTFNGGIATLYLDGRKIQSSNGGIQGNTMPLVVGAVNGLPNFDGNIDELKIYRRERDDNEIGPVSKIMWETVLMNTSSNLVLQGFGPNGKPLSYAIVDTLSPTNGAITHDPGSPIVTYTAGPNKGPDAFAYTLSDGEFTTPPTIVTISVVAPHWLSPTGGSTPPLDASSPEQAWLAGPAEALDAIWKTNRYYDCFFYLPGEYETTGWKDRERGTANPGCKHIGLGSEGVNRTSIKLANTWHPWKEGIIFANLDFPFCDGFEVRDMLLDCNAANNPKYAIGEPVSIVIPLSATGHVDKVTLRWDNSQISSGGFVANTGRTSWRFGSAQQFTVCTRVAGTGDYLTNCASLTSTGSVDVVPIGADTDQILLQFQRRSTGVDFYGLSEAVVTGPAVSLPLATAIPSGTQSQLNPGSANFSALHMVDGNEGTAWASGPDAQVRIVLPLPPGTRITQVVLSWNCQTIAGTGHLGPAADYQFQARDPVTGAFIDVPFAAATRTAMGSQLNTLSNAVTTDQIAILLKSKEAGTDFYSLREIQLQNESGLVAPRVPAASSSLWWDQNYEVLRAFDGDNGTQWVCGGQGFVVAINAVGNNLKFTGLKVVGFGTKATSECFPLFVSTLGPGTGPLQLGNILIENCAFSDPATNNSDGLTTVTTLFYEPNLLTNAIVRSCSVSGMKNYFTYSHGFMATHIQNCFASDCSEAVYYEPDPYWPARFGSVLIRSNYFLNVDNGVRLLFHAGGQFDSLTCLDNEIVLRGAGIGGAGIGACDVCNPGPSGSATNVTVLNCVVRYADWSLRPTSLDTGLLATDVRNAIFGNNLIGLGATSLLRVRQCPAGYIPPPFQPETCDSPAVSSGFTTYPTCLDILPTGYRRTWLNNRDLQGSLLNVRFANTNGDGFATQQQWH